jgi:hypothetical protein
VLQTRIGTATPRLSLGMTVKPLRRRHKSKLSGSAVTLSFHSLSSTRQFRWERSDQFSGHVFADHGEMIQL